MFCPLDGLEGSSVRVGAKRRPSHHCRDVLVFIGHRQCEEQNRARLLDLVRALVSFESQNIQHVDGHLGDVFGQRLPHRVEVPSEIQVVLERFDSGAENLVESSLLVSTFVAVSSHLPRFERRSRVGVMSRLHQRTLECTELC